MSSKELGMIHTANYRCAVSSDSDKYLLDIPQVLSTQLNNLVRQGNMFKVVGIDMTVSDIGAGDNGGQVSGFLKYYAPTRGRCAAYRAAFDAMRTAMKLQGISMKDNAQYDFRTVLTPLTNYLNGSDIINVASLTGSDELVCSTELPGFPDNCKIFDVHNGSVSPTTAVASFSAGFNTMGVQNTPTDFVLQDGLLFSGNDETASVEFEKIPFQLSYTPGSTDISATLQWRPDPALYLAIMTGQFELAIDELDLDGEATGLHIDVAIMVSGWKSIMGNPDKKKRSSRRTRHSSRGTHTQKKK